MKKLTFLFAAMLIAGSAAFGQATCSAGYAASVNGNTVTFTNTSTGNYSWLYYDFGDGQSSGNANATHTYAPGLYMACIYIGDSIANCYDSYCDSIYISGTGGGGCTASFTANTNDGSTYYFTNTSIGNTPNAVWDFGDGNLGFGSNPTNTYTSNGWYYVCLTLSDSNINCYDVYCDSVYVNGNSGGGGCSLNFTLNSNSAASTISTNNTSTGASSYYWEVFDPQGGNTGYTTFDVSYNAVMTGYYTFCLIGFDSNGVMCDTLCQSIYHVNSSICDASFNATVSGGTVYFSNTSIGGTDANWNFGDGNYGTGFNPTHVYANSGWYNVCLTISDSAANCWDTYCDSVYVGAVGCSADFVIVQDSNSTSYTLYGNVSGDAPISYLWDFGDGTTYNVAEPTHVYANQGAYTICLTITDGQGCTATYCDSVYAFGGMVISSSMFIITSIDEIEETFTAGAVFPNPSTGDAWISLHAAAPKAATINIFNTSGQLILTTSHNLGSGANKVLLDTDELSEGLYLIQITVNDKQVTQQFLKE